MPSAVTLFTGAPAPAAQPCAFWVAGYFILLELSCRVLSRRVVSGPSRCKQDNTKSFHPSPIPFILPCHLTHYILLGLVNQGLLKWQSHEGWNQSRVWAEVYLLIKVMFPPIWGWEVLEIIVLFFIALTSSQVWEKLICVVFIGIQVTRAVAGIFLFLFFTV